MGNEQKKAKGPAPKIPTAAEIKTYIMIIQNRMLLYRNKRVSSIKQKKKEIERCLRENNLDVAKAKMDSIIRDEDMITIYDILGPLCEILKERVTYIISSSECPPDLRAQLDSVMYASNRVEVAEFQTLRDLIMRKYGINYLQKADSNVDRLVNVNLVEKLKVKPASDVFVTIRLKKKKKKKKIPFEFPEVIEGEFNNNNNEGGNPYNQNNPFGPQGQQNNYNPFASNFGPLNDFNNANNNNYGQQWNNNGPPPNNDFNPYASIQKNNDNPYNNFNNNNNNPYGPPPNQNQFNQPPSNNNNPYGPPPNQSQFNQPPQNNNPYGPPPNQSQFNQPPQNNNPYGPPPNQSQFNQSQNNNNPYGPPTNQSQFNQSQNNNNQFSQPPGNSQFGQQSPMNNNSVNPYGSIQKNDSQMGKSNINNNDNPFGNNFSQNNTNNNKESQFNLFDNPSTVNNKTSNDVSPNPYGDNPPSNPYGNNPPSNPYGDNQPQQIPNNYSIDNNKSNPFETPMDNKSDMLDSSYSSYKLRGKPKQESKAKIEQNEQKENADSNPFTEESKNNNVNESKVNDNSNVKDSQSNLFYESTEIKKDENPFSNDNIEMNNPFGEGFNKSLAQSVTNPYADNNNEAKKSQNNVQNSIQGSIVDDVKFKDQIPSFDDATNDFPKSE